jgi:hypothetical protein
MFHHNPGNVPRPWSTGSFAIAPTVPHPTLQTGLNRWWTLDEASGTRLEKHGPENDNMTEVNGPIGSGSGILTSLAAEFVRASNQALTPGIIYGSAFSSPFTFMCWANISNAVGSLPIINLAYQSANASPGWMYRLANDGNLFFFGIGHTPGVETFIKATTHGDYTANQWHLVIGWRTGQEIYIQVDGGTVDSDLTTGVFGTLSFFTPQPMYAGHPGGFGLDGKLQGIGLWDRILTSQERSDLWNGGAGNNYPFIAP